MVEFLIDPFFICKRVTADVRSGQTGYAWIIDQDGVFLAHYEKDFIGQDAIKVRMDRNPNIAFTGLRETPGRHPVGEGRRRAIHLRLAPSETGGDSQAGGLYPHQV